MASHSPGSRKPGCRVLFCVPRMYLTETRQRVSDYYHAILLMNEMIGLPVKRERSSTSRQSNQTIMR